MKEIINPTFPILIVDDETQSIEGTELVLQTNGLNNILVCQDSRQVMPMLSEQKFSVILLDLSMPHISGEELLLNISQQYPDAQIIVLTGRNEIETAIKCLKMGAFDYLVKPVEINRMISAIKRAIEVGEERNEYRVFKQLVLNDNLIHPEVFAPIITKNKTLRSIFQYAEAISNTNRAVLITGASGVGKELMSRAVHTLSGRDGQFVAINISGLDDTLFSDTLFGHIKGAFTSASLDRQGLIETASGGTLFLDEIGDLNQASQVKLLRLLDEGEYFPIGSDVPRGANTRIITATNQNLQQLQEKGLFRADLYYRLQTHHIHIPSLRERMDDIPLLVDHFLEQSAAALNKKKPTPPKELFQLLSSYNFPGNIRELQSMVFDAVSHHKSKMLSMDRFKVHMQKHSLMDIPEADPNSEHSGLFSSFDGLPTLKEARNHLVREALERSNGNLNTAAQILGLSRSGLSKLIQRKGL
ncbi:sigma-54 dependent transcriptional regulator [bacterium]|nr:sigma-54 dependent transcriptional regulator [bacterium]